MPEIAVKEKVHEMTNYLVRQKVEKVERMTVHFGRNASLAPCMRKAFIVLKYRAIR